MDKKQIIKDFKKEHKQIIKSIISKPLDDGLTFAEWKLTHQLFYLIATPEQIKYSNSVGISKKRKIIRPFVYFYLKTNKIGILIGFGEWIDSIKMNKFLNENQKNI